MKKLVFLALLSATIFVACKENKVNNPVSSATFTNSGSDVELLKKLMKSYEKADWATYRSCFSDSAFSAYNQWPADSNLVKVPIDSVVANHKKGRETLWDGMNIHEPIYEVITDSTGNKYGHVWAHLTTKSKKTGKDISVVVFGSYSLKNDKIQWEWGIWDTKNLE